MEELLFQIEKDPLDTVLRRNAEDGILFYSVSQCTKYLDLSQSQVRYAIEVYRLDAHFLAGEYRIPYTAILRFQDSGWVETSIDYLNAHKACDIEGVYDLNFNRNTGHIVRSLTEKHIPLEAIPHLLNKAQRWRYDDLPGKEEEVQDWYLLDELELPLKATAKDYAGYLGIKTDWLCWKLGGYCERKIRPQSEVSYPELLDLLIDSEIINYPIPVMLDFSRAPSEDEEKGQLLLF